MTEPVAYRASERKGDRWLLFNQKPTMNVYEVIEPLYTAEQLQPRVKMTRAERVELNKLFLSSAVTIYEVMDTIYKDNGKMNEFSHLYQRLFNRNDKLELENQLEFSKLWANFNIENQEATIEIVPEMKWFVRAKKQTSNGKYLYLENTISNHLAPEYHQIKLTYAQQFNTEEEAKLWTTPDTEAVQLPVEDK